MSAELRRLILETLLCCAIGLGFAGMLYSAWAAEVDQEDTAKITHRTP